jgi:hypothetical protein
MYFYVVKRVSVSASGGVAASKHPFSSTCELAPLRVYYSATKEVVTLTSGNIAILDAQR